MDVVMKPVTIVLLGEPVAFARTRINKTGAHFTPAAQRNTAAALKLAASQAMLQAGHGIAVFDEPLSVELLAEFPVPASWPQKKRQAAIRGELRPGKRPDIDNLYKLAADACNGVVYRDDALVVEARMRKVYGVQPKIVLTVSPIGPSSGVGVGALRDKSDAALIVEWRHWDGKIRAAAEWGAASGAAKEFRDDCEREMRRRGIAVGAAA